MEETLRGVAWVMLVVGVVWVPGGVKAGEDAGSQDVLPPGVASADAGWTEEGRACVRGLLTGSLHVLEPDAGPEALRQRAMEMCPKTGLPDVSTEKTVHEAAEVISDAMGEEEGYETVWKIVWGVLYVLIGLVPAGIFMWQMKEWSDTADDFRDPAFEEEISVEKLREDPELLEKIRDKVQFVGIQRLPSSTSGRYGGSSMQVNYSAFVVDTNGETHDIAKSGDWEEVQKAAEWLGEEIGVEVKDRSYG